MQAPEQFETSRLVLCKPRQEFAESLFATYTQDQEVTRYLSWPPHNSVNDTHAAIDQLLAGWGNRTEFSWCLLERDTKAPIGMISARVEAPRVNLGYVLASSHWGQGLMTEAVNIVVAWALSEPTIYRAWAVCDTRNLGSVRVLVKAGFECEGILRQWAIHPNVSDLPSDCYCYARTRSK